MKSRISKILFLIVSAIFMGGSYYQSYAATSEITFIDTKQGSIKVATFDWIPGNGFSKNGVPLPIAPETKEIDYFFQASLGSFIDKTNSLITNTGLNDDYEITVVVGISQLGSMTAPFSPDPPNSSTFSIDPEGTVNYVEIYYDPLKDADPLTGTGYNNGIKLMSGTISSLTGSFNVYDFITKALDLYGPDQNYPGLLTVEGNGASAGVIDISVGTINHDFFPDDPEKLTMFFNTSNVTPFIQQNPSAGQIWTNGGIIVPVFGEDGAFKVNGFPPTSGGNADFLFQSDANSSFEIIERQVVGSCRMTGGNVTVVPMEDILGYPTWDYEFNTLNAEEQIDNFWVTTGGQIGAPSGGDPRGHWTHTHHGGAVGGFGFHSGTSSAPEGTEISTIECADPGWCVQARCAPFKQIFWTGIGAFAFQHFTAVFPVDTVIPYKNKNDKNASLHFYEAMVGDFGENDRPTREEPGECEWFEKLQDAGYDGPPGPYTAADAVTLDSIQDPKFGDKGGQICDKCPDYYQIRIHATENPGSDVIYEFKGFVEGGNYQIHPETGAQCPATEELVPELFE